jgi:hypothetical protein
MNYDIFKENFHPVNTNPFDIGDWKTFLELSKSAKLIWQTRIGENIGKNIEKIDMASNAMEKLYVFTDEFPPCWIYDFIYPYEITNSQLIDIYNNPNVEQLDLITLNITEIQISKEVGVCFWKKVLNAIEHDEAIVAFENEYSNRKHGFAHATPKSFEEIINSLNEDNHAKTLIGRAYLISFVLGDVDNESNSLSRQYILYMFVDKDYFVRTLIEGIGVHCEQLK